MNAKIFITTSPRVELSRRKNKRILKHIDNFEDNIGLGYLDASLEGIIECETLDSCQWGLNEKEVMQRVEEELKEVDKKIVGISSYSNGIGDSINLAKAIKKWDIEAKIIVGGYGPTIWPDKFAVSEHIDYIAIGEGDLLLPELIKSIVHNKDVSGVEGIMFKENGKFISTKKRELVKNLDNLPFPKRKPYFKVRVNKSEIVPFFNFLGSRGCYAKCGFCSCDYMQPRYMERSVENLVEEVKEVMAKFKTSNRIGISFNDINFMANPKRIERFIEILEHEGVDPLIFGSTRISDIIRCRKIFERYAKNFISIYSGAESFNDSFLKRWNKGHTLEDITKAIDILERNGIKHVFYMIGMDPETDFDELRENHNIMFKSGKLPKHFWAYLDKFPLANAIDYNSPKVQLRGSNRAYSEKQRGVFSLASIFDFERLKDIFDMGYFLIWPKIKEDERYKRLSSRATNYFEGLYSFASSIIKEKNHKKLILSYQTEKNREMFRTWSEEDKKDRVSALIKRDNTILDIMEKEARAIVSKKSKEVMASDEYTDKENAEICYQAGFVSKGRTQRRWYREAVRLDTENAFYKYRVMDSYLLSGVKAKYVFKTIRDSFSQLSEKELNELMRIPDFGMYFAYAFYYKDKEMSIDFAKRSLEALPTSDAGLFIAELYRDMGDFENAFQYANTHINFNPTTAKGRGIKARIAGETGRKDIVKKCYDELIGFGMSDEELLRDSVFGELMENTL